MATSVQLRFDVRNSPSLEAEVKERLIRLAGADPEGAGKTQGAKSDLPKRYGKGSPAGRKKGAR